MFSSSLLPTITLHPPPPTDVSAHLQQLQVPVARVGVVSQEILQAFREVRLGEEAAPGRFGIVRDSKVGSQLHLALPGTALNVLQTCAVHPSGLFWRGFFQESGTQGSYDSVLVAGKAGNGSQGALVLTERAFAQHFTRKKETGLMGRHLLPCEAEHQCMTIDAGVHVLSKSVLGALHHFHVPIGDFPQLELNPDHLARFQG